MSHLEDWSSSKVDREFCSLLLSSGLLERLSSSGDTDVADPDAGDLDDAVEDPSPESSEAGEEASPDDISDLEETLAKIFEAQVTFLGPTEDDTGVSDSDAADLASEGPPAGSASDDLVDAAFTADPPGTLGSSLSVAAVVAVVLLIVSLNPALALAAAVWVVYLGVVLWLDERFCAPGPAAA